MAREPRSAGIGLAFGAGAMSFAAILASVLDQCDGELGVALMGLDGVPIHVLRPTKSSMRDDPFEGDVTLAGVEFGPILKEMGRAADRLAAGRVRETVIRLDRATLLCQRVDEGTWLVLALAPDGNVGKARFLMRRSLLALCDLL